MQIASRFDELSIELGDLLALLGVRLKITSRLLVPPLLRRKATEDTSTILRKSERDKKVVPGRALTLSSADEADQTLAGELLI